MMARSVPLFAGVALSFTPVIAAPNTDPFPASPGIKGLQVQMADDAIALGIQHAAINVNLTMLLDLEKKPGNPKRTAAGHEFSFNVGYLQALDRQIRPLSDRGIVCYLILLAYPSRDAALDAVVIHPAARKNDQYTVGAFNSATDGGRAYLQAVTELMAERWGGGSPESGRVWGWIAGNEVNSHWPWHHRGRAELPEVVRDYAAAFRIIHSAVRQSSAHARLYVSFDHHWSASAPGHSPQECTPGKAFLDAFAEIVRHRGDIDWHVAAHPYPEDLGNPRAWADKTVTFDDNSPKVTFKNLEVLCRHLERPELLWLGRPRRVILSEQGFHTLLTPDGEALQAAAFAYAWEKCRRLPCIDAFIYHRHVDHAGEGGLRLGLWRNQPGTVAEPHIKKQIYALFQKAGSPAWDDAARFALPLAGLETWDQLKPR
jgi:Family of unknown function (DUF5722)